MKNLKKIKIGILLILNTFLICLWIREADNVNSTGWINVVFPSLMLVSSIVILGFFKMLEFLINNKKPEKMPEHANRKIIFTVLFHALLVGFTVSALVFILVTSLYYVNNMVRPRIYLFPVLESFFEAGWFIKAYFFWLVPLFAAIIAFDYSLCRYLMKRIGERFIPWSHFAVAFTLMILMIIALFSLGDYLYYEGKILHNEGKHWAENQAELWLYQNSVELSCKGITIKEVFALLNKETEPGVKINLHAPEKVQAIRISYKPNGDDNYVRLDTALEVIKSQIQMLTKTRVYWTAKGDQIDFYCIEKEER
jgi:hypothetical protein